MSVRCHKSLTLLVGLTQNLFPQKYLYRSIFQDIRGHGIYPGGRGEPSDGSGRGPGPWHHRVHRGDPQQVGEDDYNESRIILLTDRARGTWSTAPTTLVRRDCCRLAVSDGKRKDILTNLNQLLVFFPLSSRKFVNHWFLILFSWKVSWFFGQKFTRNAKNGLECLKLIWSGTFAIFNTEQLWFWSRNGSRVKISH